MTAWLGRRSVESHGEAGRLPALGTPVRGYIVGGPIYTTAGSQFTRDDLERRATANGLAREVGFIPFLSDPADAYRMLGEASTPAPGRNPSG